MERKVKGWKMSSILFMVIFVSSAARQRPQPCYMLAASAASKETWLRLNPLRTSLAFQLITKSKV